MATTEYINKRIAIPIWAILLFIYLFNKYNPGRLRPSFINTKFTGESFIWADSNGLASSIPKKTYQQVVAIRSRIISNSSILICDCLKYRITLDILKILQNIILIFNISFGSQPLLVNLSLHKP